MESREADVVVIGAGIAGLVGAGLLARSGRRVVLLESHEQVGGCLGSFEDQGFTFGVGPQSFASGGIVVPVLEELGLEIEGGPGRPGPEPGPARARPGQRGRKAGDAPGADRVELGRADWRLVTPKVDCRIRTYEGVLGAFADGHPESLPGLRRYFDDLFATSRDLGKLVAGSRAPYLLEGPERVGAVASLLVQSAGAIARLAAAHHRPAAQVAARHLRDPELVAFFSQMGYRRWSLFAAAASWYSWTSDSWYPRRGTGALVRALASRARSLGVELRTGTGAARILLRGGRASGVETADGAVIPARAVLAACDPHEIELVMLGRDEPRVSVDAVSDAYFTLFLGLDLDEDELAFRLPTRHTFFYPSYDGLALRPGREEAHRGRWVQLVAASRGSEGLAPEGCSTLVVQTTSRADWNGSWGCGPSRERTPRYAELKARVTEEVLGTVEAFLPGLGRHVRVVHGATPLTYEKKTRNAHGASAGWTWERSRTPVPERVAETFGPLARVRTRIPGLYRCGHWTLSPGAVTGAVLSAWEAAARLGRDDPPR